MQLLGFRPLHPVGGARQQLHRGVGAEHGAARRAVVAGATEHGQARDDVVARLHIGDVGADLLDDAGGLVPKHRGQRVRIKAFHEVQIGMAEAGDRRADQDLARARLRQADVLDDQRLVDFIEDGGLHRALPIAFFALNAGAAYAARTSSPTSLMPATRSPSSSAAIFCCVAFSVSRNGSPGDTR